MGITRVTYPSNSPKVTELKNTQRAWHAPMPARPTTTRIFSPWLPRMLALAILSFSLVLASCATQSQKIFTGFYFDMRDDSPEAVLQKLVFSRNGRSVISIPRTYDPPGTLALQRQGSAGAYDLPDRLHIIWTDRKTNQKFERNIDLIGRFPVNMHNTTITFLMVDNKFELFVALPIAKTPQERSIGPTLFKNRRVVSIYKDN
jgi:hypothetical protein